MGSTEIPWAQAKKDLAYLQCEHITPADIKNITKSLLDSYKRGGLDEDVFKEVIQALMACHIEHTFDEKTASFNDKLNKLRYIDIR